MQKNCNKQKLKNFNKERRSLRSKIFKKIQRMKNMRIQDKMRMMSKYRKLKINLSWMNNYLNYLKLMIKISRYKKKPNQLMKN